MKYASSVIYEFLLLECPFESKLTSGLIVLEHGRAVHEITYDQLHNISKGETRIIFAHNFKIPRWECCSKDYEKLLFQSSILPKVNKLFEAIELALAFKRDAPRIMLKGFCGYHEER
ncbi:unnamed protein product [Dovyalis caffra]|uniref:Uncharacterized protein n=1 Tax=Dovyalis caffra TaxID=77055 RepID=A0AAV1QPV5_9ROSI|nr:unnamed protein product [Dovyalis caffra]